MPSTQPKTGKEALLLWCKQKLHPYKSQVNITNFSSGWSDGLALCALIHSHRPDLIDYESLKPENKLQNVTLALDTAEKLGIDRLLDAEDIANMSKMDSLSMITYLSQFYNRFSGRSANAGLAKISVEEIPVDKLPQTIPKVKIPQYPSSVPTPSKIETQPAKSNFDQTPSVVVPIQTPSSSSSVIDLNQPYQRAIPIFGVAEVF
eukprot:TRINITY_DN6155_c0_g1_i1.p1 TRINITY_DN6155_c0_g1~~TRINITY_DN6155_c0_g1_i1.p1  ORF type:complete len:205 (+),score=46.41 TRINITY_DN6155_c0_g1_i1:32-646(+)